MVVLVEWRRDLFDGKRWAMLLAGALAVAAASAIVDAARGLVPFAADNRIHVVPPCVVTEDEVAEALAVYDEVLTLLDKEIAR